METNNSNDTFGGMDMSSLISSSSIGEVPVGVPTYMIAADTHAIANSQPSILAPSTWGDAAVHGAEFAAASVVRAGASIYNIAPTVGNWFGADMDKADTGKILRSFDDDLDKYYQANKDGIDIVGDIAASFVPGMAGVKVLNWGQKALALATEGKAGLGMAQAFGTLPAKQALYATKAAEEIATHANTFDWISANTIKSLAAGYGQNALEFAAFETAASVALKDSPIFKDHDVKDIFYNAAIGGGLIGGAAMTAITGAQTYGMIRKATLAASKVLRPFQAITGVAEGTSSSEKILQAISDIHATPEIDTSTTEALQNRQSQLLNQRALRLNNVIRDNVQSLVGTDAEVGNIIADSLRGVDKDTAFANLMGLQEAGRVGTVGKFEKQALADAKANPELVKKPYEIKWNEEDSTFVATDLKGNRIGDLMDGFDPAVTKAGGKPAFTAGVEVDDAWKGKGVGSALYEAFANRHAGNISPAGMTSESAWKVWINKFPEKTVKYLNDEAVRIVTNIKSGKFLPEYEAEVRSSGMGNPTIDALFNKSLDHALAGKRWDGKELKALAAKKPAAPLPSPIDSKVLRLHGEDAGKVFETLPASALTLGDKLTSDGVLKYVKSLGIKLTDQWSPVLAKSADEAEARYISARSISEIPEKINIHSENLPVLERAYELGSPVNVSFNGGTIHRLEGKELLDHIESTKLRQQELLSNVHELDIINPEPLTSSEIARRTNTKVSYVEGTRNEADVASDLFAMQTEMREATDRAIGSGLKKVNDPDFIETYLQPKHVKLVYNPELMKLPSGMELDAMTYLQGRHIVYQASSDAVFATRAGELLDIFPTRFGADEVLQANKLEKGNTLLSSSNGNYGSALAKAELIGRSTSKVTQRDIAAVDETFATHAYNIKNSPEAALELATLRQQMLSTPEKYVWDAETQTLRNRKIVQYEKDLEEFQANPYDKKVNPEGVKEPKEPNIVDTKAPKEIPVESEHLHGFIEDWIKHNDSQLTDRMALRNQQGMVTQDLRGTFYVPPPNPKEFPFFAFVKDPSVTGTGHVKMIWAKSQTELQALADKVPKEFEVIYKSENESYFKARREYDYNIGINENYMDTALARSGAAAPFFPKTDGSKVLDDLVSWRKKEDVYLSKEIIYNKYSQAFDTFNKLGEQYASAATSVAKGSRATIEGAGNNPFNDLIKTSLDISKNADLPIWTPMNNLVEKAFGKLGAKVEGIWQTPKSPEQLEEINKAFQKAGISMIPQDAALNLLANHTADKPVLSNFIRKANGIMSTLMLRADPLNAVNNGLGANVLLGSEAASVIRAIKAGNKDAVGGLADLAQVLVPGTQSQVLSPAKLIAGSYANFWKKIMGDADQGASFAFWKKNGIISDTMQQAKEMVDQLALQGAETAGELNLRIEKASQILRDIGSTAEKVTGNTFAEEMNRFVSADVMKQITDLGIQHGVIDADAQMSMINSFVNRTQGNNLASQRPMLFQGPVGQAIGLFQTYQFNMLQQLFRHVSEGGMKDAGILLALQGSIFGMNGLPAFNAINTHLVGGAAGNINHRDIVSTTYDAAGKGTADWLLYGLSSNMFLHPDLKVNLYSRGDINPRSLTVVPTNVADVPIVGAMTKFYGAVESTANKIANGGNVWTSFLQGVEHSGINRPLAGVAQTLEAFATPAGKSFSTTSKGDIVMQNDLMNLANLGRMAGGKPLDEAITRDAVFRLQAYQSHTNKEIKNLGASIKSTLIAGGHPTQEQVDQFSGEYMKLGGKQENFSKFMHKAAVNANASQANTLAEKLASPYSKQMQSIMGGYELADFKNDANLN